MDFEAIIRNFIEKGIEEGLSLDDYNVMKKYHANFYEIDKRRLTELELEKYKNFKLILEGILLEMKNSGILMKINPENVNYIMQNCDLLPLVYANRKNNEIVLYGRTSYRFLCHFHLQKNPSLGVTDEKNLYYCYGCGAGGNVYDYLMEYENLSFTDSVYLLSEIYHINLPIAHLNITPSMVEKYRQVIISREYKELLEKSYKRLTIRHETSINVNGDSQTLAEYFDDKFSNIERIKNNTPDVKFHYLPRKKCVFLNPNDYLIDKRGKQFVKEEKKEENWGLPFD